MRVTPRLVQIALAPGALLLFLGAFSPMLRPDLEDGGCGARAWQAAWRPEDLRITGDRTPAEVEMVRRACHRAGKRTIALGRDKAVVGVALLASAGAGLAVASRASRSP